jgi:hypothetical protein
VHDIIHTNNPFLRNISAATKKACPQCDINLNLDKRRGRLEKAQGNEGKVCLQGADVGGKGFPMGEYELSGGEHLLDPSCP